MEEKELTDEQIIKAFEHCNYKARDCGCTDCPYSYCVKDDIRCNMRQMRIDTLDLIHRLQSENESLKKQIEELPKPRKKILANKVYSDSTLKKWSKEDLIEQIRILEHNWSCAEASLANSVKNSDKIFFEQKSEIAQLKSELSAVYDNRVEICKDLADKKAEIERLTEENGQLKGYNSGLEYDNAELQKQVDELKSQNEWLTNEKAYLKQCADAFLGDYKNAVKDTAKEILTDIEDCINGMLDGERYMTKNEVEYLLEHILNKKQDYGV